MNLKLYVQCYAIVGHYFYTVFSQDEKEELDILRNIYSELSPFNRNFILIF
jgi:hypothetical protein